MSIASPRGSEPVPFAAGGLDSLLAAAARDCPDAILVSDDAGPSTAAEIARRMDRLAGLLRSAGLAPAERVLIAAGAQTNALVALAGALRAGLVPVMVPCGISPVDLAACAGEAAAAALIGPGTYGDQAVADGYLSAAALAESVRVVATQGPQPVDGALDVSDAALDAMPEQTLPPEDREPSMIGTLYRRGSTSELRLHRQAGLLADALSLVEQARINPSKRMVVTLPPSSVAGLVAGPFAALIGASSLAWHGPFEAKRFLLACDADPGAHLVAPAAIGPIFREPALAAPIGSLILVSRFADAAAFVLPEPVVCDRPIVDLYAFGEDNVLAQRRVDGTARPPARVTDKSLSGGLGARLNLARAAAAKGEAT